MIDISPGGCETDFALSRFSVVGIGPGNTQSGTAIMLPAKTRVSPYRQWGYAKRDRP